MKKLRTFEVKFIGWTNTKPSRVKITDLLNGVSVSVSPEKRNIYDDAFLYLQRLGIICESMSEGKSNTFLLHSDDFSTSIN